MLSSYDGCEYPRQEINRDPLNEDPATVARISAITVTWMCYNHEN